MLYTNRQDAHCQGIWLKKSTKTYQVHRPCWESNSMKFNMEPQNKPLESEIPFENELLDSLHGIYLQVDLRA